MTEPATADAVAAWIDAAERRSDPFDDVRRASEAHRERHGAGCTVYPTSSGRLLAAIAAATAPARILEIGTGLGYSALCLASGAGRGASVETVERDDQHAALARAEIARAGYSARVVVHAGRASAVLPSLTPPYDLVFSDSDPDEMPAVLDEALRLLRSGGLLVSANLFLAQFAPEIPHLDRMASYRERIVTDDRLLTAFAPGGLALSVVRGPEAPLASTR